MAKSAKKTSAKRYAPFFFFPILCGLESFLYFCSGQNLILREGYYSYTTIRPYTFAEVCGLFFISLFGVMAIKASRAKEEVLSLQKKE